MQTSSLQYATANWTWSCALQSTDHFSFPTLRSADGYWTQSAVGSKILWFCMCQWFEDCFVQSYCWSLPLHILLKQTTQDFCWIRFSAVNTGRCRRTNENSRKRILSHFSSVPNYYKISPEDRTVSETPTLRLEHFLVRSRENKIY